jgi:hypothetical protein
MTARTRRRLTVSLVLGLMTLPAEALLFPVAMTPNPGVAAVEWAASLSPDDLTAASNRIDQYPPIYRRAIMGELDPAERSSAWRLQFSRYLSTHPSLTEAQRAVVQEAIAMATPDVFAPPVRPELREKVQDVFKRATSLLGPKDAGELFVTMGPRTGQVVNALPLRERIANQIRSWRTVSADSADCNCNIEIDTCDLVPDPWLQCSELYTCNFDLNWPMCGPFWSWACTGWCKMIRWPSLD